MAARFRIDQTGPGPGTTDRSRSDLVAGQAINLVVPDPVPGAVYTWEIIHKLGSAAGLLASTGAAVSIGPAGDVTNLCGFMIELTETVGPTSTRQRRVAAVRGAASGLRTLLFGETASPGARLSARSPDASTDNEIRTDLGGTGETGQAWAGYTDALYEMTRALEEIYEGGVGGGGGSGGHADTATFATTAGSATRANVIRGLTIEGVLALGTWTIDDIYVTTGRGAADTFGIGAVDLVCRAGAASVDGVTVFASLPDRHLRASVIGPAPMARSTSLPWNPATDATAALQNILDGAMQGQSKTLYFAPGSSYRITDTIETYSTLANMRWFTNSGDSGGNVVYEFVWGGADDRPMFRFGSTGVVIEQATFRVNNSDCLVLVDMDRPPATRLTLDRCIFTYGAGSGVAQYGFGIGVGLNSAEANLEEVRLVDCTWYGCNQAAVYIRKGQPYGIHIIRPTFHNYRVDGSHGTGILIDESRCTVNVESGAWGRLSCGILNRSDAGVILSGMQDCENVKRIYWNTLGGNLGKPFEIRGGRMPVTLGYGVPGTNPTIAAENTAWIEARGVSPIKIHSLNLIGGYQPDWHISVSPETPVMIENCLLPTSTPVRRNQTTSLSASRQSGGTYMRGCFALASPAEAAISSGDVWVQLPDRDGPESPNGSDTLTGLEVSLDVGFAPGEYTIPEVQVWEEVVSGTPVPGTLMVRRRSVRGCNIRRSVAPGVGNTVRVHWAPRLPRPGRVQRQRAEGEFFADTLMATTVGEGPVGTTTNYWWSFLVNTHEAPGTPSAVISCASATQFTGWCLQHVGALFRFSLNNHLGEQGWVDAKGTSLMTITYDGITVRTYSDGTLAMSTALASWTPVPSARVRLGVSSRFGWLNTTSALLSAAFGTGVPTAPQVLAHARATKEYGHVRPIAEAGVVTQHRYVFDGTGAATDLVGDADISLVSGTAPVPRVVTPGWATF